MQAFALLYDALDQTNRTNDKVDLLEAYFRSQPDDDKLYALALLSGRRPRRTVNSAQIRAYAIEAAAIPLWLFEESYHIVGDLAETVSLLLPPATENSQFTLTQIMQALAQLDKLDEPARRIAITEIWGTLTQVERLVFTKLITGSFRVGVSQNLVVRAIAQITGQEVAIVTHRITGGWSPESVTFEELVLGEKHSDDLSRPYPFFLAYPLDTPQQLGQPEEWSVEWKWDGIRSQLIRRQQTSFIWSRGEDLITDKFPELNALANSLPDGTVVDGEILPFLDGNIAPFAVLQTRIGRKNLTLKALKEAPVILYAYDLLEYEGNDIRTLPLSERRQLLSKLVSETANPLLILSKEVLFHSWDELTTLRLESRAHSAEGFMLKRRASTYQVGRRRGDWWKWKVDPLSVDAVMIYAQRGHGRRADLYTDYTFAVWDNDRLVPFAKAYSGLTDVEIAKVDRWVKANTVEKFGPVRTVKPELVFEIGFEGIGLSPRHKSGIAVRFPRILRWRTDKPKEEADTIQTLKALLTAQEKDAHEQA
jgi:DNA ligase 1